jgi:hypothetical protein
MSDIGFNFIKEMTKEDLIEEVLKHQRRRLEEVPITTLRIEVIEQRVNEYKKRLADEAGVVATMLGYALKEDENE